LPEPTTVTLCLRWAPRVAIVLLVTYLLGLVVCRLELVRMQALT
jgi:hypothetical protein